MELFDSLGGWPFVISTVLALGGIGFAIWTWRRSKRARLITDIEASRIGLPGDPDLRVTYKGEAILAPTLVVVRVQHVGGQEVPEFRLGDIRLKATDAREVNITLRPLGDAKPASEPKVRQKLQMLKSRVVALLGDSQHHALLDPDSGDILIKPRIFKHKEQLTLTMLCIGDPKFIMKARIANVDHRQRGKVPTAGRPVSIKVKDSRPN